MPHFCEADYFHQSRYHIFCVRFIVFINYGDMPKLTNQRFIAACNSCLLKPQFGAPNHMLELFSFAIEALQKEM